ncbi:MAG: glutamine amidotransferase-related protein, partial [Minisyncoccales bacterium]
RNVCGLKEANSSEFKKKCLKIIDILPEQKILLKNKEYGGTMRKGDYDCEIKEGTLAFRAYQKKMIKERHRHRFEFNNNFREILEKRGLIISGINPQKNLVEIVEIKNHPFFLGVQFHPEFKSTFLKAHPLFLHFIKKSYLTKK